MHDLVHLGQEFGHRGRIADHGILLDGMLQLIHAVEKGRLQYAVGLAGIEHHIQRIGAGEMRVEHIIGLTDRVGGAEFRNQ